MYLKRGAISTLRGRSLKLVGKLTYLGSNVSSTENNVNIHLAKAWTAINRLSIIWKSDLSNKLKQFFLSCGCVNATVWMHQMDTDKMHGGKAKGKPCKNTSCSLMNYDCYLVNLTVFFFFIFFYDCGSAPYWVRLCKVGSHCSSEWGFRIIVPIPTGSLLSAVMIQQYFSSRKMIPTLWIKTLTEQIYFDTLPNVM